MAGALSGLAPLDVAVVCALRCEARPLVRHLGLESLLPALKATLGTSVSGAVGLRIGGVGIEAAARAVDSLAELADEATCWLNLGCAGGRGPLGELVAAHRVSAAESDEVWYPQFPFAVPEPTVEVCTVDRPQTIYLDPETVYDMEAAGFYAAALARASFERVHVLKVRVDGPGQPVERLSARGIEARIEACIEGVSSWIERLSLLARDLRSRHPDAGVVDVFLERWHFTVSQEVQLRRLLGRMHALSLPIRVPESAAAADSRRVIEGLRRELGAEAAALHAGRKGADGGVDRLSAPDDQRD